MWNNIINATVSNNEEKTTYIGNLVNYLYEGPGSLTYEETKIEYRGNFSKGKLLGLFLIIDHYGSTIRTVYYDENEQIKEFNSESDRDIFLLECEE